MPLRQFGDGSTDISSLFIAADSKIATILCGIVAGYPISIGEKKIGIPSTSRTTALIVLWTKHDILPPGLIIVIVEAVSSCITDTIGYYCIRTTPEQKKLIPIELVLRSLPTVG